MARVLFTSTPGLGHVTPMLRLARALRDRGHDVRWALGPDGCPTVERAGFVATPAGLTEAARFAEYRRRHPEAAALSGPQRRLHAFPNMFGGVAAPALLADVLPVAEAWRPDLVVRDAAEFAGAVVAARLGVPCVLHSFGVPVPEPVVASADPVLAGLWRAYGLDPVPYTAYDALYVDVCPPALHTGTAAYVPLHQPVRPTDAAPPEPRDRPLVYVTFGTVVNTRAAVFPDAVAGVAATGVDVLVTVGKDGDPAAFGDLPSHVTVERFVPQAEVLPRCAAVVSHGGSGTTFAALAHGLPNVLLPQGADQFLNAEQVAACGAAVSFVDAPPSAADVTAAVDRVLGDASYATAARRVAEGIAAMPDPATAAVAVEALLGEVSAPAA